MEVEPVAGPAGMDATATVTMYAGAIAPLTYDWDVPGAPAATDGDNPHEMEFDTRGHLDGAGHRHRRVAALDPVQPGRGGRHRPADRAAGERRGGRVSATSVRVSAEPKLLRRR